MCTGIFLSVEHCLLHVLTDPSYFWLAAILESVEIKSWASSSQSCPLNSLVPTESPSVVNQSQPCP